MESPTSQWLKELENEELDMVDHLSMEQLAESLANELWNHQPPQDQQWDHQQYQVQLLTPISSAAGFSPSAGDAVEAFPAAASVGTTTTNSGMISFAGGSAALEPPPSAATGGGDDPARSGGRVRGSASVVQEHIMAERKRREKMQHQFAALASIIPDTTKTDKISLLGSTIRYVDELEERVKALREHQNTAESSPAMMFDARCCIGTGTGDDDGGGGDAGSSRPSVEASVRGTTVLLRITCREKKGLLIMVLTEVERRGLSVINTSVVPFGDGSSLTSITITAQIEDGSSSTTVELVKNLDLALRNF